MLSAVCSGIQSSLPLVTTAQDYQRLAMSVAQSIFEKICPACASIISVTTERCECGYAFTFHQGEGGLDNSLEMSLRDEELYENYLAARAAQAQEAARAALSELALFPDDTRKAADAELAQEVAKSLEADLNEQRAKIRTMQAALPKRPEPIPSLPVATPVASRPQAHALNVEVQPAPASMITITASSAIDTPAAAPPTEPSPPLVNQTVEAVPVSKPVSKPVSAPASPLISAARAASVLESIKQAKARERADRFPQPDPQETTATMPGTGSVPPPAFRAEQAARAQQAITNLKALDEKCCPNCTSSVPKNTTRCRCGYTFVADGNDLPSLTLCTGDFSALRDSFNLNLRRS